MRRRQGAMDEKGKYEVLIGSSREIDCQCATRNAECLISRAPEWCCLILQAIAAGLNPSMHC